MPPFRWKKKNRFSQLVADHLQSPKHGASLVVQTGFPTSLIDLYVRNRTRFIKSPSPSPSVTLASPGLLTDSVNLSLLDSYDCSENSEIIEQDIYDFNLSVELLESESVSVSNSSISSCCDCKENKEIIEVEGSVELAKADSSLSSCCDCKESKEVIEVERSVELAKAKADLLLSSCCDCKESKESIEVERSVELVKADSLLSSCCDFNEEERRVELAKLNHVIVVMLKVLILLVLVLGTKRFTFGITVSAFLLFLLEAVRKTLVRRTSLVDTDTAVESKVCEKTKSVVACSKVIGIKEVLDEVRSEDLVEVRRKSSRRAIMKSRMKKLVPKKLRRSANGLKGEISGELKDVTPLVSRECSDSKVENFGVLKQEYDEIVEKEKRFSSLTYPSEIYCDDNKLRMKSRQNAGSLVLCLIVLVGLIGGRVLALSLALFWCLMLKTLQWRNVKFFVS